MTALATQVNQHSEKNIMSINANARIDYILKFSRHMVVAIDDLEQGFGATSGTYLASLPDSANACLVTISNKLNDVQVRARINEQLFPGQPFDPEIALTQSVTEHYRTSSSPVAIVVEQAQHLSLQIIHELTLLAELAKKSGKNIQVVLLGTVGVGHIIVNNFSLFNKKLSMISVHTGQLLTANAEIFKHSTSLFTFTPFNKLVLGMVLALAVTFAGLFFLYQRDSLQFSQLPGATQNDTVITTNPITETQVNPNSAVSLATASDVLSALQGQQAIEAKQEQAAPSDILSAISFSQPVIAPKVEQHENSADSKVAITETTTLPSSLEETKPTPPQNSKVIVADSFRDFSTGVVIQYAALEINDAEVLTNVVNEFATRYSLSDYMYYQRLMRDKPFVVITSKVFDERKNAADAMLALPIELQNSGIWLKSVETIHKEMSVTQQ